MIKTANLTDATQSLTPIRNRGEHTSDDEVMAAFSSLGRGNFKDADLYLGSFDGNAGWERHLNGDELVQVVSGETEFDLIVNDEKQTLSLSAGSVLVVPQGCWHRFRSDNGVTVLTATPEGDEGHRFVDDPRDVEGAN